MVLDTMTTGHRLTVSTNLQYRHQSSYCLPSFDTAAIYLFVSSVPVHREQGHTQSDRIFLHGCGFTYKNCFVLICDSTRTSRSVIRLSWLSSELGKKGTHLAQFPDTPCYPRICWVSDVWSVDTPTVHLWPFARPLTFLAAARVSGS